MQPLIDFFGANGFIPHGYCLTWSPGLLWLHVLSDAFIVLAYYSIPLTLFYFIRQRKDLPYPWLFTMFALFIVACGTTHLFSAITVWVPLYWLDGIVKAFTAVISVAAAVAMWWVVPRALKLRSAAELEAEVRERKKVEAALQQNQAELQEAQRIAHVGNWRHDVATGRVTWSEELYRIFGLNPEQPPPDYQTQQKLFTPKSWALLNATHTRTQETGIPYEIELEIVRVDGEHGWIQSRGEAIRDAGDVIVALQGVAMDITERMQAEIAVMRHVQELGERIKEIECLRDITFLLLNRDLSIGQVLDACVKRIPAALVDPSHSCARIQLDWEIYESANFREEGQRLTAAFAVSGMGAGLLEIFCFGDAAGNGKSPFLDEEHVLIQSLSTQITQLLEKRLAETALQQKQKDLYETQRIGHVGSWQVDVATNHVVWTEELYRIFGLDPALPVPDAQEHRKFFTPESAELLTSAVQHTLRTGMPYELELEMSKEKGSRWILVRGDALRDAAGAIATLQGIAIDITERKRAEAALKLHKAVIDTTSDGFWICDPSGYLLEVNQAYADKVGYTREELVGMHISKLSELASTPEMLRAKAAEIIEQGHTQFETRHHHKDGHTIDFESTNTYLPDSNIICCFLRDITERKHMEEALRESEYRYRTLVEHSPVCIHEIDMEGKLTSMNRAGLNMMGTDDECTVRGLPYLTAVSAADRERVGALLARAYAGETSHFEFRSAGQRGRIYKSCFVPVLNSAGNVEKLMGITEDVTEHRMAEEKIRSLAFYDTLTLLPNRRLLNDRMEQILAACKRYSRHAALMFMDLDNFKSLNDQYGHDAGDLLLVEAARRISGCVREMDTVARFGGDEFVVILGELDADRAESVLQVEAVAEKIRAALSEPYTLVIGREGDAKTTIEHNCTVSIGVELFIDRDVSKDVILKHADMAMYQAKQEGGNMIRFHATGAPYCNGANPAISRSNSSS